MEFPRRAIVTKIHDGLGYSQNDSKYLGPAWNRVIQLVGELPGEEGNRMYLTNLYFKDLCEQCTDYIYHGYLVVSDGNIELLDN